tara:strand:+ start:231 stop:1007 length:777 start_codon:yes stop_codon:yes gene_type:complete
MEPGQGHKIVLAGDSLDGDMSADAIRFEVIDDLPSVFADSVKFVTNDGEDMNYVHADHLGAPQKMTDADRSLVWDASFLPFGEEDSLIGSAANDNRFPGQRLEAETGLHYNYFRDYDPTTGRYLQSDPIGLAGGINTYGYVSGNPVMYTDPKGLFCIPCLAPLAPAAGELIVQGAVIGLGLLAIFDRPDPVMCNTGSNDNDSYNGHGDNPEGKTGKRSTWDKHSGRRAGKAYGQERNAKRGKKNQKHTRPQNPNRRHK